MYPSAPPAPSDTLCDEPYAVAPTAGLGVSPTTQAAAPPSAGRVAPLAAHPLFPPRGADEEARRRWVASSPWPEVVFASAV